MTIHFKCTGGCGQRVADANVMVNRDFAEASVLFARVVCKVCTNRLDASGSGQTMQNLWEVGWVARRPLRLMFDVFASQGRYHWATTAIDDLWRIMQEAHPDLCKGTSQS
jgi:hypothetical protein